jgi:hypothetical protein
MTQGPGGRFPVQLAIADEFLGHRGFE